MRSGGVTRQPEALRGTLAMSLIAVGAIANVAWIGLGSWMAASELGHVLVYVADRLR